MQIDGKHYEPKKHRKFKALRVRQPYADAIAAGLQNNVIMPAPTRYRGLVLIISAGHSDYNTRAGMTICYVDLKDVAPVEAMTSRDKKRSGYPEGTEFTGYIYRLANPRKVIEIPARGHQGIHNVYFEKDDIKEYPTELKKRPEKKSFLNIFKRHD